MLHQPPVYIKGERFHLVFKSPCSTTMILQPTFIPYANNIHTHEGGTHEAGFKSALTRVINDYARRNNLFKDNDSNLTGDDIREGLTAIISVKIPDPQFEGQTKTKLGNSEARSVTEHLCRKFPNLFGRESRGIQKNHQQSSDGFPCPASCPQSPGVDTAQKRAGSQCIARETGGLHLPQASDSELFMVEGDSAGGTAKQGRDRMFQAILPLKGKIINVEKARLDRAFPMMRFAPSSPHWEPESEMISASKRPVITKS